MASSSSCSPSFFRKFFDPLRKLGGISSHQEDDPLMWSYDLGRHSCGKFSFATVQANAVMEDYGQVEIRSDSIFFGIYDGHRGPDAAQYINDHLFLNFISLYNAENVGPVTSLKGAIRDTENGFLDVVRQSFSDENRMIAATGSCCLVGFLCNGKLDIAYLGDSRAVLGFTGDAAGFYDSFFPIKMTTEHNANIPKISENLVKKFGDENIVRMNNEGSWRVKGIQELTNTIGDAFLKLQGYAFPSDYTDLHVPEPITQALISSEPSEHSEVLKPEDRFIIFASAELWKHLPNKEAVRIVSDNPPNGIAQRLIKEAQRRAAGTEIEYKKLLETKGGDRRQYHDDISVIVVFINKKSSNAKTVRELSIKSASKTNKSILKRFQQSFSRFKH